MGDDSDRRYADVPMVDPREGRRNTENGQADTRGPACERSNGGYWPETAGQEDSPKGSFRCRTDIRRGGFRL